MSELPGPIEPTTKTTISTANGALYAETFLPAGTAKGAVLVTHGYAEHCGRYREVAHVLVKAGWAALLFDVRGHGQSPGARGAIDRFETYLVDFRAAHAAAKQLAPGKPLVLLGHSHGSLITLRALCDSRPPDAVAAIAPVARSLASARSVMRLPCEWPSKTNGAPGASWRAASAAARRSSM